MLSASHEGVNIPKWKSQVLLVASDFPSFTAANTQEGLAESTQSSHSKWNLPCLQWLKWDRHSWGLLLGIGYLSHLPRSLGSILGCVG